MNGTDLLEEFRRNRSEEAFRGLVQRYTNLVFSVAHRRLGSAALAQEAAQVVFLKLARIAPPLRTEPELVAWLHRTTLHVAISQWRSESRRHHREQQVAAMQPAHTETAAWNEVAPVVDEALNELGQADRQTLLLRFFDQLKMRELGAALGVTEEAAKMRVGRALERLRQRLTARGISCGTSALAAVLAERATDAAPSQLIQTLATLPLPVPGSAGMAAQWFDAVQHSARFKVYAGGVAAAALGAAALALWISLSHPQAAKTRDRLEPSMSEPPVGTRTELAPTNRPAIADAETEPDPVRLLQGVAEARRRIVSGALDFIITTETERPDNAHTNRWQMQAVFEGRNLRFEQVGREYAYVGVGAEGEASVARMRALQLDRESGVRLGYLEAFESKYVTAYDGESVLCYRETTWTNGRRSGDVTIDDASKGGSQYLFDPRCLGLAEHLRVDSSVDDCLGYREAKYVKLVGKDTVEDQPAWHVHLQSKHDVPFDLWVSAARTNRLLKVECGPSTAISRYDPSVGSDPLPTEVSTTYRRQPGQPPDRQRISQIQARLNVSIGPEAWTLAGLGLPIGTPVVDVRNRRRLGYWNGIGFSEDPPPKREETQPSPVPPNRTELLALLEKEPSSKSALEAAAWILLNTPDGADTEKAAEILLREHIGSPDLVYLAQQLERVRPQSGQRVLRAMLEKNPSTEVKGNAGVSLAAILKEQAEAFTWFDPNPEAPKYLEYQRSIAETIQLLEHLISKFGHVGTKHGPLAHWAKPELDELRRSSVGRTAPEIEGEDLQGQPFKLSQHRGEVVVIVFWTASTAGDLYDLRPLIQRNETAPIRLIGILCDQEKTNAVAKLAKSGVALTSIHDGRDGAVSRNWNVNSWLNVVVVDKRGVIRHRGSLHSYPLAGLVDALLAENLPTLPRE